MNADAMLRKFKKMAAGWIGTSAFVKKTAPQLIEYIRAQRIIDEFRTGRLSAAACASIGQDVDAFLTNLGATRRISAEMRLRIQTALLDFEPIWRMWNERAERCEQVFWNSLPECPLSEHDRLALHRERRLLSEARLRPLTHFGFLIDKGFVPAIKFSVPSPAQVFHEFHNALNNPEILYAAPDSMPAVTSSHSLPGQAGAEEYLLRFASPSDFMQDTVFARVFEPAQQFRKTAPTLIYCGAFGMAYDQLPNWPEEDRLGRPLAQQGFRVVVIESPWHGRRTPRGYSGGEFFLATSPAGCIKFLSAKVQELSVVIDWAKSVGSPAVAVAGMSLGSMAVQQMAAWCHTWPSRLRPDAVLLCASGFYPERIIRKSSLSRGLGISKALAAAGWTRSGIDGLSVLYHPPADIALDPSRIIAVLGRSDTIVPYRYGLDMVKAWRLPEQNIITWNTGHLGVLLDMLRTTEGKNIISRTLTLAAAHTH